MTRTRRHLAAALALLVIAVTVTAACTDEGNQDAFCDRVGDIPLLVDVLGELDSGDPAGTEARLERALQEFRALETDAPGEIKADMARLRQGVELVLEAVENNPDDLPGAREAILAQQDELAGLAQAGESVASYVVRECSIQLDPGDPDEGTDSSPSTTEG